MLDILNRKIRQMHAALAGLASDDLSAVQPQITFADGYIRTWIDFNQNSDAIELANVASLLVSSIASLRDHLKLWCTKQGIKFDGDTLINNNRAVALVYDLWNIDKHGELDRPPRSGHKPKLTAIRTALNLSTGTSAGSGAVFTIDPRTAKIATSTVGGGSVQLAFVARVVDENGVVLGDFTQICTEAADAWSLALKAAGVPLSL